MLRPGSALPLGSARAVCDSKVRHAAGPHCKLALWAPVFCLHAGGEATSWLSMTVPRGLHPCRLGAPGAGHLRARLWGRCSRSHGCPRGPARPAQPAAGRRVPAAGRRSRAAAGARACPGAAAPCRSALCSRTPPASPGSAPRSGATPAAPIRQGAPLEHLGDMSAGLSWKHPGSCRARRSCACCCSACCRTSAACLGSASQAAAVAHRLPIHCMNVTGS